MERNDIALFEKLVQRDIFQPAAGCGELVICDDVHSEAAADIRKYAPDPARADYTDGLSVQLEACHPDKAEIVIPCADECLVYAAYGGEQQRHGVLGDGVRRICGNMDNVYPAEGVADIDIVVARAAQRDQAHAH